MNSGSTGSPALSQLGFCLFLLVFLVCFFKWGWRLPEPQRSGTVPLAAPGPAGRAARPALRPAAARGHTETAPRPGPRCRSGTSHPLRGHPSALGRTIRPGRNHPLPELCLAQGTSAAASCPEGLGIKTRIAALAPAGNAAPSPRGSAASRCGSRSPVGSRSIENLISHSRQERWGIPLCHPRGIGGSEALVPDPSAGCQLPAPAGDKDPGGQRDSCHCAST